MSVDQQDTNAPIVQYNNLSLEGEGEEEEEVIFDNERRRENDALIEGVDNNANEMNSIIIAEGSDNNAPGPENAIANNTPPGLNGNVPERQLEQSSRAIIEEIIVISDDDETRNVSNTPTRKRKRSSESKQLESSDSAAPSGSRENLDDNDDSKRCIICCEEWEFDSAHRLISLKCGHLFGESCVLRWFCTDNRKICPLCNQKAALKDIRPIFAKKIIDRSVEMTLRHQLTNEQLLNQKLSQNIEALKLSWDYMAKRMKHLESDCARYRKSGIQPNEPKTDLIHKLNMEMNFSTSPDSGSRVIGIWYTG